MGGTDQLDAFCDIYAERMRELGTPVYPRRFFAGILEHFPDLSRVCCVYAGDRPVAAGLLIGFKDRLEIPWAASLTAFNRQSPNMLLYWQALRFGCEHGYRWFDFGRSMPGAPITASRRSGAPSRFRSPGSTGSRRRGLYPSAIPRTRDTSSPSGRGAGSRCR
jgi:hypothetical protein